MRFTYGCRPSTGLRKVSITQDPVDSRLFEIHKKLLRRDIQRSGERPNDQNKENERAPPPCHTRTVHR